MKSKKISINKRINPNTLLTPEEEELNAWMSQVCEEMGIDTGDDNKRKEKHMKEKAKGIFCLECDWVNNLKKPMSIEPALLLLKQVYPGMKYIHRDVGTKGELEYYINKWKNTAYDDFQVLYLAFHGSRGKIHFGDQRIKDGSMDVDELEEILGDSCKRRIIYFGSCSTLDLHGNRIKSFLRKTKALAVCGYRTKVDWLTSTILDLLLFKHIQDLPLSATGARKVETRVKKEAGGIIKQLDFKIII